jgi:hypothetical protein
MKALFLRIRRKMMILQEMRKRNRQTNENDKKNIDDSPT